MDGTYLDSLLQNIWKISPTKHHVNSDYHSYNKCKHLFWSRNVAHIPQLFCISSGKRQLAKHFKAKKKGMREKSSNYEHSVKENNLPFKKLRWFSKIWLISWIHNWRTPGLAECKIKVSVTSPVLDVSANLHGSLSTFSSKERQLTFTKKTNKHVFHGKHTFKISSLGV